MFCLFRAFRDSLKALRITKDFLLSHVLKQSPYFKDELVTLNGKTVLLRELCDPSLNLSLNSQLLTSLAQREREKEREREREICSTNASYHKTVVDHSDSGRTPYKRAHAESATREHLKVQTQYERAHVESAAQ